MYDKFIQLRTLVSCQLILEIVNPMLPIGTLTRKLRDAGSSTMEVVEAMTTDSLLKMNAKTVVQQRSSQELTLKLNAVIRGNKRGRQHVTENQQELQHVIENQQELPHVILVNARKVAYLLMNLVIVMNSTDAITSTEATAFAGKNNSNETSKVLLTLTDFSVVNSFTLVVTETITTLKLLKNVNNFVMIPLTLVNLHHYTVVALKTSPSGITTRTQENVKRLNLADVTVTRTILMMKLLAKELAVKIVMIHQMMSLHRVPMR